MAHGPHVVASALISSLTHSVQHLQYAVVVSEHLRGGGHLHEGAVLGELEDKLSGADEGGGLLGTVLPRKNTKDGTDTSGKVSDI